MRRLLSIVYLSTVFFCPPSFAGDSKYTEAQEAVTNLQNETAKCQPDQQGAVGSDCKPQEVAAKKTEVKDAVGKLEEFDFALALGLEAYRHTYIQEARLYGDEKTVRVTDSKDMSTSLWFDTHYSWDGWAAARGFTHSAPGFYVGARLLGENGDVFDALSIGVMWAFKRRPLVEPPTAGTIAKSINIGVGPVWHRTRVLAGGIKNGEVLPAGYSDVEYKKEDEISWMVMISAGF